MISYERGPLRIFVMFRDLLGFEHDSGGRPTSWPTSELAELVSCVWCLSVWTILTMWLLWQVSPEAVMVIAAMSLVVMVERFNHG